jgi:hypothetical protein
MRTFRVVRDVDISGVSGTGDVAQGVTFFDGQTVVRWVSPTPSTNIYDSMADFLVVHGHNGSTRVEYLS